MSGENTSRPFLECVTLVCIDTDHPELGLAAMRRSMAQLRFGVAVFFNPSVASADGIDCRWIERFGNNILDSGSALG